jgi:hypothetical protein
MKRASAGQVRSSTVAATRDPAATRRLAPCVRLGHAPRGTLVGDAAGRAHWGLRMVTRGHGEAPRLGALLLLLVACSSASNEPKASVPPVAPPPVAQAAAPVQPPPAVEPVPSTMSPGPAEQTAELGAPAPLDEAARAVFLGSAEDEPPVELGGVTEARKNQHYVSSNERTLEAFYPRIQGLRGGYLGVGSDQAYLMIGWARSELAWLTDYDPVVVDIHSVYHALFAAADSPAAFRDLWRLEHKPAAIAAIKAAYPAGDARRRELLYRRYRARIAKRLDAVIAGMTAAGVPCFLTDQAQYSYVRDLVRHGRVRPLVADLTQTTAVQQLAAASSKLATPVRVVYLSNAEEYWNSLSANFRTNIARAARRRPLGRAAHPADLGEEPGLPLQRPAGAQLPAMARPAVGPDDLRRRPPQGVRPRRASTSSRPPSCPTSPCTATARSDAPTPRAAGARQRAVAVSPCPRGPSRAATCS